LGTIGRVKLSLLFVGLLACSSSPATKAATSETTLCIVTVAASDVAAHKAPGDIVLDAIHQCGASALLIASTLEANRALVAAVTPATHAAAAVDVLGPIIDAAKAFAVDGGR
jgi:hypothetical protein